MSELTWKARDALVKAIKVPDQNTHVPLIIHPLKLPCHTYKQVSLRLYVSETKNLVWCCWFKNKKRIATLKRSMDISL